MARVLQPIGAEAVADAEQRLPGVLSELEELGDPAAMLAVPLRFDVDEPFEGVWLAVGAGRRRARVERFVGEQAAGKLVRIVRSGHGRPPRGRGVRRRTEPRRLGQRRTTVPRSHGIGVRCVHASLRSTATVPFRRTDSSPYPIHRSESSSTKSARRQLGEPGEFAGVGLS